MPGALVDYLRTNLFVTGPIKGPTSNLRYSKWMKMKLRGSVNANTLGTLHFAMARTTRCKFRKA